MLRTNTLIVPDLLRFYSMEGCESLVELPLQGEALLILMPLVPDKQDNDEQIEQACPPRPVPRLGNGDITDSLLAPRPSWKTVTHMESVLIWAQIRIEGKTLFLFSAFLCLKN